MNKLRKYVQIISFNIKGYFEITRVDCTFLNAAVCSAPDRKG